MTITPIYSAEQIARAVQRLAHEIQVTYGNETPVIALCLLNGALWFAADLLRLLPCNFELHTLHISSYEGTSSTGTLQWHTALPDCKDKHVLVIDDVLDTGLTLHSVCKKLRHIGAASVKSAVAITKDGCNAHDCAADFCALHCDNQFLVGYGLDYNGKYRNLPYVGAVTEL